MRNVFHKILILINYLIKLNNMKNKFIIYNRKSFNMMKNLILMNNYFKN